MTKLAEVVTLPGNGYAPCNSAIAQGLRRVADRIEAGEWGDVNVVISLIEPHDGNLDRVTIGENIDVARVAGLLAFCQHQVMCH